MNIQSVRYTDADHINIEIVTDQGVSGTTLKAREDLAGIGAGPMREAVLAWISAGNTVADYVTPPAPVPTWTPLEFMERFTKAERATIRAAAKQSDDLADWLDLLRAAGLVLRDDPRTQAGMDALVAAGLLTQARCDEILAT